MAKRTGTRTPLDVRRAILRAEELVEAEISQIFVNRQTAGSQPTDGAPPKQGGNMSGGLGSASAAVSNARGAIFGIRGGIRNLFNRTAPPLERVMSDGLAFKLAVLAVISAVVAVISLAIYKEWQQHIISQTEIAAAQAQKSRAETDVAGPFNDPQVRKLEPEAAVSKEVDVAHPPSSSQPTPSSMVSNAPQLAKVDPSPTAEPSPMPTASPKVEVELSPTPSPSPTVAPTPEPTPLRTSARFDCINGKHLGTDYVICASPELVDAEARLEDAYDAAHATKGQVVHSEQRSWIKRYGPDCGLPRYGRPAPTLITSAAPCVLSAMESRIRQLRAEVPSH
jgi:uncharacterized protein YecT (DUF1311 family)